MFVVLSEEKKYNNIRCIRLPRFKKMEEIENDGIRNLVGHLDENEMKISELTKNGSVIALTVLSMALDTNGKMILGPGNLCNLVKDQNIAYLSEIFFWFL